MKHIQLKRKFEEVLSEGRGKQLLWLLIVIVAILLVFGAIAAFVFKDGSMVWQDLIALFLDPGCFGGAGAHDFFRLTVSLLGLFLFSALLISVVSNIFENIAESFKLGFSRYHHRDHVLILGGGHQLISMIFALIDEDRIHKDEDIVVLTTQSVDDLRSKLFSLPFLDEAKEKALRRRLTLYYGDRDNENNLTRKDLAKNAKSIYIIGEDNEEEHDSINIRCCKMLQSICGAGGDRDIKCYMVLTDSSSVDVYKYVSNAETLNGSNLKVDIIDANEYIAEQVLVADHDGKYEIQYPKIDYRSISLVNEQFKEIPGIRQNDENHVRFVIAGFTDMARSMALTAAHICHFPNFGKGKRRTVISFVDKDMSSKMKSFICSLDNLFTLSHYSYISFDAEGDEMVSHHDPDRQYGDFLDIEWEFIDEDISSPGVRSLLNKWSSDKTCSLSLAICMPNQADNAFAALHLPKIIYAKGYPIFVHQHNYGDILKVAKSTGQFGNLHAFGMASNIQDDPLFESRSTNGQRVNFIYNQEYGDPKYPDMRTAWFTIPEAHKFSSIYCANGMRVRERSFDISKLNEDERSSMYEVEHRRWMTSALILGYSPVPKTVLDKWKEERLSSDESLRDKAKEEYKTNKNKRFIHYDITPYDELIPSEQEKDKVILDRISFILQG